jgi:hypothetical protein
MMAHVVLFRPKPELSFEARRELLHVFSTALREIGSIRRVRIGRRRTFGRSYEQLMQEDFTHAAILEFDDLAGLASYLDHPAHQKLGAQFFATFEKVLIYDFEMTGETWAFDDFVRVGG